MSDEFRHAWCAVLGTPDVEPTDDFFVLGGDSMAALRFAALASRAGVRIGLQTIFDTPNAGQLSRHWNAPPARPAPAVGPEPGPTIGPPLTIGQALHLNHQNPNHYNNVSLLYELQSRQRVEAILRAIRVVYEKNSALQYRFDRDPDGVWKQERAGQEMFRFESVAAGPVGESDVELISRRSTEWQAQLDVEHGPTFIVGAFTDGSSVRSLLFVFNHVLVDFVSVYALMDQIELVLSAESQDLRTIETKDYADICEDIARVMSAGLETAHGWTPPVSNLKQLDANELEVALLTEATQAERVYYGPAGLGSRLQRECGLRGLNMEDLLVAAIQQSLCSDDSDGLLRLDTNGRRLVGGNYDYATVVGYFSLYSYMALRIESSEIWRQAAVNNGRLRGPAAALAGPDVVAAYGSPARRSSFQSPVVDVGVNYLGSRPRARGNIGKVLVPHDFVGGTYGPDTAPGEPDDRPRIMFSFEVEDQFLKLTVGYNRLRFAEVTVDMFADRVLQNCAAALTAAS